MTSWELTKALLLKDLIDFGIGLGIVLVLGGVYWFIVWRGGEKASAWKDRDDAYWRGGKRR